MSFLRKETMAQVQRKNVTPRHEAIVDWEILNPEGNGNECAEALGILPASLSVIRHSDAFIDYRARRLAKHHENVSDSVIDKTENLAKLSLDILAERFHGARGEIPLGGVKDTCEMALKALGFGQNSGGGGGGSGGNTTNILIGSTPDLLARAREKMLSVNGVPQPLPAPPPRPPEPQETPQEEKELAPGTGNKLLPAS